MEKILFEIYKVVTDYLCGNGGDDEQLVALSKVVDLYMQICNDADKIPVEINGLLMQAVDHINMSNDTTLADHIADGYSILEELSGYLGEYFS
jgi:hypothetical protein